MKRPVANLAAKVAWRYRQWIDPAQAELRRAGVITMGEGSYGDPVVVYHEGDTAKITIGKYCSIASGVSFMPGGNHRIDWVSTYPFRIRFGLEGALADGHPATKGDIVVGNDVWIGNDALILSGVTVGDGAVVATKTVVTKDVPAYGIVAGNPGRVVSMRFDDATREALLRIRWWDWPPETIRERVGQLNGGNVEAFVAAYG